MPHSTLSSKQPKKVLIIEDEADMCLLLNIMLTGRNIHVDHVKTLAGAMLYFDKEVPDLVMLDNNLPDGLGLDFITHIKTNYPSVKIIMISGYHSAEVKDVALDNGADLFLTKPFTKEQIYHAVHDLLNLTIHEHDNGVLVP